MNLKEKEILQKLRKALFCCQDKVKDSNISQVLYYIDGIIMFLSDPDKMWVQEDLDKIIEEDLKKINMYLDL